MYIWPVIVSYWSLKIRACSFSYNVVGTTVLLLDLAGGSAVFVKKTFATIYETTKYKNKSSPGAPVNNSSQATIFFCFTGLQGAQQEDAFQ